MERYIIAAEPHLQLRLLNHCGMTWPLLLSSFFISPGSELVFRAHTPPHSYHHSAAQYSSSSSSSSSNDSRFAGIMVDWGGTIHTHTHTRTRSFFPPLSASLILRNLWGRLGFLSLSLSLTPLLPHIYTYSLFLPSCLSVCPPYMG